MGRDVQAAPLAYHCWAGVGMRGLDRLGWLAAPGQEDSTTDRRDEFSEIGPGISIEVYTCLGSIKDLGFSIAWKSQ